MPAYGDGSDDEAEAEWEAATAIGKTFCRAAMVAMCKRRRMDSKMSIEWGLQVLPSSEACDLTWKAWRVLQCFQVPTVFYHILALMFACPAFRDEPDMDMVEWFCGMKELTMAAARAGCKAAGFDMNRDAERQNMNSEIGLVFALQFARRLHKCIESLGWFGTVCSSWIFLSRGTTLRTLHRPRGNVLEYCVREGNRMTARSALLIAYLYSTGCTWCLEQPISSLMVCYEPMQFVFAVAQSIGLPYFEAVVCMGAFDTPTAKASKLYSNSPMVRDLEIPMTEAQRAALNSVGVAIKGVNSRGERIVSGGPKLKGTQAYTRSFGEAVMREHQRSTLTASLDLEFDVDDVYGTTAGYTNDAWKDLALDQVYAYLLEKVPS